MSYKYNALANKGIDCCFPYIVAMKQKLTKEELFMLARLKRIDFTLLSHMQDCLDPKRVRSKLIQYEFTCLAKEQILRKGNIISALMRKYSVSKSYIEQIIYAKRTSKGRSCVRCGKLISAYKWGRNNGVCDSCITKAIKNYDLYEAEQSDNDETIVGNRDEEPSGD